MKKLKTWGSQKTHQVKVEGWARAAIAVAATTKGSIAERAWDKEEEEEEEESVLLPTCAISLGLIPNDSNDTFPSRLCDPTLPINGEVEHANIESLVVPLLRPLERLEIEEEQNEEEEEEDEEVGLNEETKSFGLERGERERKGIEDIEEVDMGGGGRRSCGLLRRVSGCFRRAFEDGKQRRGGDAVRKRMR
jgi:hypothetical protein